MNKVKTLLIILSFALPYLLVYRSFFLGGELSFGDAPFFYPENLRNLFYQPLFWDFRNDNFGNPQFQILWLFLPTFIYGLLNNLFNLSNIILIRIIFYFPATILAILGFWLFIGQYIKNNLAKILATTLYGFNTYFLVVLDGGQVGVALSYGLFPLLILTLRNFLNTRTPKNFLLALIFLLLLANIDLRVFLIAIFLIIFWELIETEKDTFHKLFKKLGTLLLIIVNVLLINLYWLIPFISYQSNSFIQFGNLSQNNANFINLINSLSLFHPHFPLNEFGNIFPTPFYFLLLPFLIFSTILIKSKRLYYFLLLYLMLVFLTKGSGEPFGFIYTFFISLTPLAIAFRDSSKFFIPLIFLSSFLLALSINFFNQKLKNKKVFLIIGMSLYLYLLFLIYPALTNKLSGALNNHVDGNDYNNIYQQLSSQSGFFRTLWFSEKPPLAFGDWHKPALSANNLYQDRPFASLNTGQYDLFNFLHQPSITQWFNLLGIKYVFFPDNERKKTWTEKDIAEEKQFNQFIQTIPDWQKINWNISFPVFSIPDPKPKIFAQKRIFLVLGGEDIYEKLFQIPQFALTNQGFIFLEDYRINIDNLLSLDPSSAVLLFNNKSEQDLLMTNLKDKMIGTSNAIENEWQFRRSSDYLTWKYDLLKNDIDSKEFDFNQGISFSTNPGEKIKYDLNIPQPGNYYVAIRYTNASSSAGLKVNFLNNEQIILNEQPTNFKWDILGPISLDTGKTFVEIINLGNFSLLNTVALISQPEFDNASKKAALLMSKFPIIQLNNYSDNQILRNYLKDDFIPVSYKIIDPTQYSIEKIPQGVKWLVFSEHYNSFWKINRDTNNINLPFYAMINGFYLKDPRDNMTLSFSPQIEESKYLIASLLVVFLSLIIPLVIWIKKSKIKT